MNFQRILLIKELIRYCFTYGIVVENKGVLIFMKVVERALGYSIFNLDRAFNVLLV